MTPLLYEARACVVEEGLNARIARQRDNHLALRAASKLERGAALAATANAYAAGLAPATA